MNRVQFLGDLWKIFPQWSRTAAPCQECQTRFRSWHFERYDHEMIQHGSEPPDLSFTLSRARLGLSAESGCPLCTIAMHTLRLNAGVDELKIKYQFLNTNPQNDPSNLDLFRVQESWQDVAGKTHETGYDFWVHASEDNSAGTYFRTRDINPVVDSQSAYERARKWIEECSESHQDCLKPEIGPLPSRVIDVEPLKNNDDPRLLITEGIKAPYVALSYCWGSNQPNALLSQRLPEYVKRIPTVALPQTIQDAITVTAKLGIRYLWVDSFCVLQDSPTDKRMEISKMRQIFRRAFVTISAATAPSVFHGFLFTRTQPDPSVSIQLRCPDGTDGVVSLYLDSEEPHLTYLERDHPIEDRAWTLEEKVLSPRVLVYSSTHLRWLCDSSQYSDGGPQENFMGYDASAYRLPLKERERPPHPSQNNVPSTNQRSSWRTLVGEYTRRSLTAPEDKLRAIAGLAEEYERLMGDTYRAGLWLSELATELLWRRNTLTEAGALYPRPRNYRAPSWSWASIDGEVAIRQRRIDPVKFNVVECTTTPVSAFAPFGEVSDARLKVVARTTTVWWNCAKEDIFDGADGVKLGKGVQDAAEDDFSALCAVQALAISANHGLILAQAKSEEGSYRRVGWLYFDNDDMFSQCEQTEITII